MTPPRRPAAPSVGRLGRLCGCATTAGSLLVLALAVVACGSEQDNPPAAEPADSPPAAAKPAGNVLELGGEAEGVAVDPADGLAAVAFRDPDELRILDLERERAVSRIPLPGPARHLEMAQDGTTVLVPIEYTDELARFDLAPIAARGSGPEDGSGGSGTRNAIGTGDFPHDAVEAANGTIFVGDEGADTVTVIRDGKVSGSIDVPEQPGGVATSGDVLAVVSVAAREISFYDTTTLERLAVLDAGAGPSHVVAGDDGLFYVADTGGDAILVYDATPTGGGEPRFLDRANVPGSPYGLAIDNEHGRLYVTQTARNRLAALELTGAAPRAVGSYPTVRQPNSAGVDERSGEVIVAGRTGGEVQILDPEAEEAAGT